MERFQCDIRAPRAVGALQSVTATGITKVLIVQDDRLACDLTESELLLRIFCEHGLCLIEAHGGADPTSSMGTRVPQPDRCRRQLRRRVGPTATPTPRATQRLQLHKRMQPLRDQLAAGNKACR